MSQITSRKARLPLLAVAMALSLAACGQPTAEQITAWSDAPSNWYERGWIYADPAAFRPNDIPTRTVADANQHSTPSYVERPNAGNDFQCVIHMPAPGTRWHLTVEQYQGVWVKERSLCNRLSNGAVAPDGNSPLDVARSGAAVAFDVGHWQSISGQAWDAKYAAMGGPRLIAVGPEQLAQAE